MNHIGGENRAGLALMDALGTPALPNACGHVNWHHMHCNAKAHAAVPRRRTSVGLTLQEYTMLQRTNKLQTSLHSKLNATTVPAGRCEGPTLTRDGDNSAWWPGRPSRPRTN